MFRVLVFLLSFLRLQQAVGTAGNSPFMLVSGISAASEMCLAVENGNVDVEGAEVSVEPCLAAVAAGDGRELWQSLPNGQISNVMGKKCLALRDNAVSDGGSVVLMDCDQAAKAGDGSSIWETQGSGQLKLGRAGQYCLSQSGSEAGVENVAEKAGVVASSVADAVAHGASMAVDGRSTTFWASSLDPTGPVSLTVDLGAPKKVKAIGINWEYPAKSFTVSLTADGVKWEEVFATDSNILSETHIPVGLIGATKVRIVMHEAHATRGAIQGHAVYGIKALSVMTPSLRSVVEDCADASRSRDARDKYFQSYVGEAVSCSSKALRSELPSLEAARAALAGVAGELVDTLPKLSSCRHGGSSFHKGMVFSEAMLNASKSNARGAAIGTAGLALDVERANGIDVEAAKALMAEARGAILAVREAVF